MREVICVNVGQAGVQLSNATWELLCVEHGLEATGRLKDSGDNENDRAFRTFFQEVPTGQYVPRTITIDLEPTVVDEVRSGPYRNLFHPDQLMSSMEDGASNFARGCFTIGKKEIDHMTDTLRKLVDACEMLQGFFLFHSSTGGTGSGFTTLILDRLSLEYTKRNKFQFSIFPSPILSTAVVEPYNCALGCVRVIEKTDVANIMDNEAIYSICTSSLDITRPSFSNINRVISQVFSDVTVSLRFDSSLNSDLDQICTNLIPYPRIHFPVTCHTPLISSSKAEHEPITTTQLTKNLFDKSSQMVSCILESGKYMSCVIQYRGKITPKEVNQSISDIKRKAEVKFVDWCPTGFKLGVNSQPPICIGGSEIAQTDKSATLLANSTSIVDIWDKLMQKFDILFSKRSFIHWYVGEGMEESEFMETRDEISMLYQDYAELGLADEEGDEENEQAEEEKEVKEKEISPLEETKESEEVPDEESRVSKVESTEKEGSKEADNDDKVDDEVSENKDDEDDEGSDNND